jgi:hypothetical protein
MRNSHRVRFQQPPGLFLDWWIIKWRPGFVLLAVLLLTTGLAAADKEADPTGSIFMAAKAAVANGSLEKTRLLGFGIEKSHFQEAPGEGAILIGLDLALGKSFDKDVVFALRPIYMTEAGETATQKYGLFTETVRGARNTTRTNPLRIKQLRARPGYAVGGITVRSGLLIDGLSLTYMRITGQTLDAERSYDSDWVGNRTGGSERTVSGNGAPIVGVFGSTDEQRVRAIGLIAVKNATVANQSAAVPPQRAKPSLPEDKPVDPPQPTRRPEPPAEPDKADIPPANDQPAKTDNQPAAATQEVPSQSTWLLGAISAVVTVPILVFLLAFSGRKKSSPYGNRPGQPTNAAIGGLVETPAEQPVEVEPILEEPPAPSLSPTGAAAICEKPRLPNRTDNPEMPHSKPPRDGSQEREDLWCKACRLPVFGGNASAKPWCPRCGGDVGPLPKESDPLASLGTRAPVSLPGSRTPQRGSSVPQAGIPMPCPDFFGGGGNCERRGPRGTCYKVTVGVRCWKQHTCLCCDCVYRYKMERKGEATAGLAEYAQSMAEQKALLAVKKEVDVHPCPTCGLVQPEMGASQKMLSHGIVALATFLLVPFIIIPAAANGITLHLAGMIAASVAGIAWLVHLLTALDNPNGNRAENRKKAKSEVDTGQVEVVQPGTADKNKPVPGNLRATHALTLLGILLSVPAFLAPVYVKETENLPTDPDLPPFVIAPGDEVRVTFPAQHNIQCVSGLWHGNARARILNASEAAGLTILPAATQTDSWGEGIFVKSSEKNLTRSLHATVKIPKEAKLGGKTLRVEVGLDVTYPSVALNNTFTNRKAAASHIVTIQLANLAACQTYRDAFAAGTTLGLLGCVGGGLGLFGLAFQLRSRARPTEIYPIGA